MGHNPLSQTSITDLHYGPSLLGLIKNHPSHHHQPLSLTFSTNLQHRPPSLALIAGHHQKHPSMTFNRDTSIIALYYWPPSKISSHLSRDTFQTLMQRNLCLNGRKWVKHWHKGRGDFDPPENSHWALNCLWSLWSGQKPQEMFSESLNNDFVWVCFSDGGGEWSLYSLWASFWSER